MLKCLDRLIANQCTYNILHMYFFFFFFKVFCFCFNPLKLRDKVKDGDSGLVQIDLLILEFSGNHNKFSMLCKMWCLEMVWQKTCSLSWQRAEHFDGDQVVGALHGPIQGLMLILHDSDTSVDDSIEKMNSQRTQKDPRGWIKAGESPHFSSSAGVRC